MEHFTYTMRRTAFFIPIAFFLLCLWHSPQVRAQKAADIRSAKSHWTMLGGYGLTHPGLGSTETRVETIETVMQYGHFLFHEAGESWYRVRHEILIEVPFSVVTNHRVAIMAGINFLACWDFVYSSKVVPFVFAGGGPLYTNLDIPGLGSDWNGSYQGGLGVHYFTEDNMSFDIHYRLHHISNANTAEPNEPLNASIILFGISLFR